MDANRLLLDLYSHGRVRGGGLFFCVWPLKEQAGMRTVGHTVLQPLFAVRSDCRLTCGGLIASLPPLPDCRPTRYGPDCSLGCQCAPTNSYCNARNGQCLCLHGYMGPTCREGNV